MTPIQVELPTSLPADLRAELAALLAELGPVSEPPASYNVETALLILALISASADILATVDLLLAWRGRARSRGVNLDKVSIVAGDRRINLANVDRDTLVRLLQELT